MKFLTERACERRSECGRFRLTGGPPRWLVWDLRHEGRTLGYATGYAEARLVIAEVLSAEARGWTYQGAP